MYVDTDTLEGLIDAIDFDGVKELLNAYVLSTQDVITNLKKADEEEDLENIRFFAHRLKGSSGTLGLTSMQELGKEIETFAKAHDIDSARADIDKVEGEFSKAIEALKQNYPQLF